MRTTTGPLRSWLLRGWLVKAWLLTESLLIGWWLSGPAVFALEPHEIAILVNRRSASSREVAEHYCERRGVPRANIIELSLPLTETISRPDYERLLMHPLRDALVDRKDRIRCVLSTYGVPLRVNGREPSREELQKLVPLRAELAEARQALAEVEKQGRNTPDYVTTLGIVRRLEADEMRLSHKESTAAVDSELMLLWQADYPLTRWQPNPLHWQMPPERRAGLPPVLLTCRLDGPTPEIAKRLVDDAVAVEADGLTGRVYVDARGIAFDPRKGDGSFGYGAYDASMVEMAQLFPPALTTLDTKNELFPDHACPDAMLYCGWYSHGHYRPSCQFVRGAVAWHLASSEAITLRDPQSKVWCPNLLKAGVAATLGPVAEPYTLGFPKPAEFFGWLATGQSTLAETYGRTVPFTSWMMVLVGDPLYNPFRQRPLVKPEAVKISPAGSLPLFRTTK